MKEQFRLSDTDYEPEIEIHHDPLEAQPNPQPEPQNEAETRNQLQRKRKGLKRVERAVGIVSKKMKKLSIMILLCPMRTNVIQRMKILM